MATDNRYKMNSMGVPLPAPLPLSRSVGVPPCAPYSRRQPVSLSLSLVLVGTFLGRTKQAITLVNLKHGRDGRGRQGRGSATFFLFMPLSDFCRGGTLGTLPNLHNSTRSFIESSTRVRGKKRNVLLPGGGCSRPGHE